MTLTSKKYNYFRWPMIIINIALIAFLLYVIVDATYLICNSFSARIAIEETKNIPISPNERIAIIFFLLTITIVNLGLREVFIENNKQVVSVLCILDIFISLALIYFLNFSYKGILFLTFSNIIHYVDKNPLKYFLCSLTITAYVLFDYNILSYFSNIVSIDYLTAYFEKSQQLTIYTSINVLSSINEILLFLFMIAIVQDQVNKKNVIKNLYSELNVTVDQLKNANLELERYAELSDETAKIKERNRLAREIHDTMGHTLTGISVGLEACLTLLDTDVKLAKEYIAKLLAMAKNGLLDVRRSVRELKVDAIEKYTLIPAIEKMAEDMQKVTSAKVILDIKGEASFLASNEEEAIYRIVQESTTNSLKHGRSSEINISICFGDFDAEILITDNGESDEKVVKGFGITHMEERVSALNGKVKFIGKIETGFCVNVLIPLKMRSII